MASERVDANRKSQGSGFELLYESTAQRSDQDTPATGLDLVFAVTRSGYTAQVPCVYGGYHIIYLLVFGFAPHYIRNIVCIVCGAVTESHTEPASRTWPMLAMA